MLRTAILALALAASTTLPALADDTATVTLNLTGLQPQGAVMLQVFNSEAAYRAGTALTVRRIPVTAATARVEFSGVTPGQYAVRLFHDVNGDGQFNTNPFGIPTEPFAFSNNAVGRFGPASWADAAFTVNAGANAQQIAVGGQ